MNGGRLFDVHFTCEMRNQKWVKTKPREVGRIQRSIAGPLRQILGWFIGSWGIEFGVGCKKR